MSTGNGFRLDPRIERDSAAVAHLDLCGVRLMRDARWPWLILVPARAGLREVHDLAPEDGTRLFAEIATASRALAMLYKPTKINVGALGNVVPQLHVHVVARRSDDPAWPGPVWGHGRAVAYAEADLLQACGRTAAALNSAAAA